jgi:hypothetical protein
MRSSCFAVLLVVALVAGCAKEEPPAAARAVPTDTVSVDTAATETTSTMVTSTGPQMTSEDAIFAEIKRRFGGLSPGTVAFNAPKKMRVATTSVVTLRIAPKGESIGTNVPATTTSVIEHVTPIMEVNLDGGEGVEVKSLTPQKQAVAGGGAAEWRWNVTPSESGAHTLTVTATAHLTINGEDVTRNVWTQAEDVDVSVNVRDFVENHWEWAWGALLVPLGGLLLNFFQRRRKRDTVAAASGTPSANAEKK